MPKLEKGELDFLLSTCDGKGATATRNVRCAVIRDMVLEIIQLRAEKKCQCVDLGKPGVGESWSYANEEDV